VTLIDGRDPYPGRKELQESPPILVDILACILAKARKIQAVGRKIRDAADPRRERVLEARGLELPRNECLYAASLSPKEPRIG